MRGFSSQWITTMIQFLPGVISWWLKHGAMDPLEGTLRWMLTDWTSELSVGRTVVSHFVGILLPLPSLRYLGKPPFLKWSCAAQLETRFSPAGMPSALHTCSMQGFRFFPASVVTLVSGEVKHVVHLIHLNWNSCLLPMWFDRQRSRLTEWRTNF